MKKVAIFGGTGFVGNYLVDALLQAGWQPVVLVRPGSEAKLAQASKCQLVQGDIQNTLAIEATLDGCEAAIYSIGILREFPAQGVFFDEVQRAGPCRVIDAASRLGVKRCLLISANGVQSKGTAYQQSKFAAEIYLQQSSLDWTIFQPSVLFGDPKGKIEFATQLYQDIICSPFPAPLFFQGFHFADAGRFRMAPAHVKDIAEATVYSLGHDVTIAQTYSLCGPENLSWKTILKRIAEATGHKKWMLPAPAGPISFAALFLERFPWFPLTRDHLKMLFEENICDDECKGFSEFGISPRAFDADNLDYLK